MGILTYLNPYVIKDSSIGGTKLNDNSISSSKIDGTVASKSYVDTQVKAVDDKVVALETKTSKIESDVIKYSGLYFYNLFGSKTSSEVKSSLYYPGYYPGDEEIDDLTYYTGLINHLRNTFNTKYSDTVQFYAIEDMSLEQYKYYGYFYYIEQPEIILYNTGGKSYDFIKITCYEDTDDWGHTIGWTFGSVSTFSFPMEVIKNKVSSLETKNTELTNTITELEPKVINAVQITYAELKSLRDAGKLVPGTQYRITDYVTTTTQANTKSAGHVFDIIVTADDESTLNEEARAINHKFDNPDDDYFKDCNLSAWKIWYCLDNDTDRFAWAIIGELIGTIKPTTGSASGTYTYNSSISKIMFIDIVYNLEVGVRTQVISHGPPVYVTKTDNYTLVVEDEYGFVNGHLGISVYTVSQEAKGVIYRMIDEFNNDVPYDFKNIQFKHPNDTTTYPYYYYTFASDNVENNTDNSLISNNYYSNTIKKFIYDNKRKLNCIIFIGGMCYNNTFGNNCWNNTFGNNCWNNTFGNDCSSNTFESYFQQNTFGDYCYYNSFGNVCKDNTFGNYCRDNAFGHECLYNSFGCGCKNIKFASDSSSAATKYEYYQNNHFGDGCQYILFKGKETASNSQRVQNYNFAQGLQGTDNEYLIIDGVRGRSFETKVAKNSNGELKTYCEADLIL